ncbi:type I methionyl aminopeptidase [Symmachiella dynata]|uniref:type I methionyl aminopeptidase n=1 Tax=Symmachiella dynata TaxID=2527995 RepID=UPI0011A146D5|nr:type I methionyl aminopeptidase [Symmachiella dynata]
MIVLKSPAEIEKMREAGRVVAQAHRAVGKIIAPGVSTRQIDDAVERVFAKHNATPLFKGVPGVVPFPAATCISINDEIVHGIPSDRLLEEGDLVSVDTGCRLDGWCGDAAWTYAVGRVDEEKQELMAAGQLTLTTAIHEMQRQKTWAGVAEVMETTVKDAGFSVVEELVGHGIGREMHEDPQVPNFVTPELEEYDFELVPGMVLAVEPMLNAGTADVCLLDDHWTIVTADGRPSVHYEHTLAITAEGVQILTAL